MKTFETLVDLRYKLLELSPSIFSVRITSESTGNVFDYKPVDALEWLSRYADSIITSNENAVLLDVGGKQYKLTIWRNVPQRVDLMGI